MTDTKITENKMTENKMTENKATENKTTDKTATGEAPAKKAHFIKRMYDWVLSWSEKPSAQLVLFLLAFAESSFFPIPPDVLLIPLVLGFRKKWFRLALMVTIGSTLGGAFGYYIGHFLWYSGTQYSSLAHFFFNNVPGFTIERFQDMAGKYELYGFWIVFAAGFTIIPYKIFTVSSGAFNLNFITFMIASGISRGARFFLVAFLLQRFGEPIKEFIDKYFNWLAIALTLLLIGGFIVIKHFM